MKRNEIIVYEHKRGVRARKYNTKYVDPTKKSDTLIEPAKPKKQSVSEGPEENKKWRDEARDASKQGRKWSPTNLPNYKKSKEQGVAEGMDPEKRARLDDLIDQFRDSTDPNDYYDRDYSDPEDVIAMIRAEFGDRIADKVAAGADKMHFSRPGHTSWRADPLGWKKPVDRQTKAGKMYKQDSDFRKNTIKSRYKLSGKSSTESSLSELSKDTLRAYSKAAGREVGDDQRDAKSARDKAIHHISHGELKKGADWSDEADWLNKRAEKRAGGIAKATSKIAQKNTNEGVLSEEEYDYYRDYKAGLISYDEYQRLVKGFQNRERDFGARDRDRDRGPWYLKVDGRILKVRGEPKAFDWKSGANNYGLAILKNKPELRGRIVLTKKLDDSRANENTGDAMGTISAATPDGKVKIKTATGQEIETTKDQLVPGEGGSVQMKPAAQDAFKPGTKVTTPAVSTESATEEDMMAPPNDSASPIHGDNDHDEISKLLVKRLKYLAGLA